MNEGKLFAREQGRAPGFERYGPIRLPVKFRSTPNKLHNRRSEVLKKLIRAQSLKEEMYTGFVVGPFRRGGFDPGIVGSEMKAYHLLNRRRLDEKPFRMTSKEVAPYFDSTRLGLLLEYRFVYCGASFSH